MYAYIKGELAEKNIDHIVVEAGGIGYLIYVPAQSIDYLPDEGDQIKVYTYLYIREDAMVLYGFLTKDDLEIFKMLITVSGIGPKGGLGILSTLSADDLRFAILSGDSKTISKAPGIGAKTAQRVIIDLKDKMSLEEAFEKKLENNADGAVYNLLFRDSRVDGGHLFPYPVRSAALIFVKGRIISPLSQDGSGSLDDRHNSCMIGGDESGQHFGQYIEPSPLVVCQNVDRVGLAEYGFCFGSNFNFQIAG